MSLNIDNEFIQLSEKPITQPTTIDGLIHKSKVEYSERLDPPPICLEFLTNQISSIVGTLGNFSAIIGKAKSRKTFLVSMIVAAAVRNGAIQGVFNAALKPGGLRVILFDTEQARHKVQQIQHRIIKMAGVSDAVFEIYALRPYTPEERVEIIEEILKRKPDLGLMVIDGIRDLVYDINNPEEATKITTKLLQWTGDKNIHLITVLHQNKGDNNARGHLGTEIINKAETTISVTVQADNKAVSMVEPEYCREKPFEPFAFMVDESGHPAIMEDWVPSANDGRKRLSPHDIARSTHVDFLSQIFTDADPIKYGELVKMIKNIYSKNGVDIGDNKAKDILTYCRHEKIIDKSKEGYLLAV